MIIDMHSHTSGISLCSRIDYKSLTILNKELGYDAFILTNHYTKDYVKDNNPLEFAKRYIEEYYKAKEVGDKIGIKVFFGVEITLNNYGGIHLLVYGIEPELLLDHPEIYNYTLPQIYEVAHSHNGFLVQAHPFRPVLTLLDVNYLDGVEINCHLGHNGPFPDEVFEIAKKHNLFVTCGGDFHNDSPRIMCGIITKDYINDVQSLIKLIISKKGFEYLICDKKTLKPYKKVW